MTPPAAAGALAPGRAGERGRLAPAKRPARRVSGPVRRQAPAAAPRRGERGGGLLLELLSVLERLASHRLLERLLRGRAWLGLVTFALIGIVTLQLGLLKLNGAVGRSLQSEAALQRENASLSIENSELAATDRVQSRATQLGMEFASSAALRFLTANAPVDLRRSASVLSAPVHASTPGGEESSSTTAATSTPSEGGEHGASEAPAAQATAPAGAHGAAEEGSTPGASAPAGGEGGETSSQTAQASPTSSSQPSSAAGGTQAAPNG